MKNRVKKIFKNLDEKQDIILIKNSSEPYIDKNFFYVTGLETGLFEGSIAILFPDGEVDLIVSELESETAKKAYGNLKVYKENKDFQDLMKDSISFSKKIGLNYHGITHLDFIKLKKNYPNIIFSDVSKSFEMTRLIKDELEIEKIKISCNIIDKVVRNIPKILHEGIAEYELAAEIGYLIQKNGADKTAFDSITSFGKNSSEPHYTHGTTNLKKGDIVLCDIGASYRKYNSDITRTFVFGRASEIQKEMYNTVLEAQSIAFSLLKGGIKVCDIHKAVDMFINKTKFKGKFIHSTGHSLGLSVHDGSWRIGYNCDIELCENMVFTIEPGIYLPEIGGVRIEDDILIKKDDIEILTKSPRNLIEI